MAIVVSPSYTYFRLLHKLPSQYWPERAIITQAVSTVQVEDIYAKSDIGARFIGVEDIFFRYVCVLHYYHSDKYVLF